MLFEQDIRRMCKKLGIEYQHHQELGAGFHNHCILLNDEFVLRTGSRQLKHEHDFLLAHDIGPEVCLYDAQSRTLVTKYVRADHPDNYSDDVLQQLAKFVTKLQAIPISKKYESSYITDFFETNPSNKLTKLYELYQTHPSLTHEVYVHTDLALENILLTNPLTIIDWEFVQTGPRELEVAFLMYKLLTAHNESAIEVFLESYPHELNQEVLNRCVLHVALNNLIHLYKAMHKPAKQGVRSTPKALIKQRFNKQLHYYTDKFL